jgi:hypothetical protein
VASRAALGVKRSLLTVVVLLLAGCQTSYDGYDSGIDGVLWRQIAFFEDPLSLTLFQPSVHEPVDYLEALEGARWDGTVSSAAEIDLDEGGIVLYDISSTDSTAALSVFISSGPRPAVPTDEGRNYNGPSAVYTCYEIKAQFKSDAVPVASRKILDGCPEALVDLVPKDAAFASGEVFDG